MRTKQVFSVVAFVAVAAMLTPPARAVTYEWQSGHFCTRVGESDTDVEFNNAGAESYGALPETGRPRFWCPISVAKDTNDIDALFVYWRIPANETINIDCVAKFMSRTGTIYTSGVDSDYGGGTSDQVGSVGWIPPFSGTLPSVGSLTVYCDVGSTGGASILGLETWVP